MQIEFIAEEWPAEWVLIARMKGNEHLTYQSPMDWGLVFVDPEGVEWITNAYSDPILGTVTIECSPEWFSILNISEDDWDYEHTDEDFHKFAREFCIPNIWRFTFEHVSYVSKDDPNLPAKLAGKRITKAPEWAWQNGEES